MEQSIPDRDEPGQGLPQVDPAEDALRRLQERLGRASDAAERLLVEAIGSAAGAVTGSGPGQGRGADSGSGPGATSGSDQGSGPGAGPGSNPPPKAGTTPSEPPPPGTPPPAGWQIPGGQGERQGDLDVLLQVLQSVRDLIPPELQQRLADAMRELLLAIRALIDWYLERSEQRRPATTEVQDIPIL